MLPSLARLGVAQILPASAWSSLPEPAASQFQAFAASPRGMRSMRDEQSVYREVLDQAQALTSLDGKPGSQPCRRTANTASQMRRTRGCSTTS